MLNLATDTREGWFDSVKDRLDLVLIDHAHLEKRAASTALSMIFHYTGRHKMARALSEVVQEEMDHFARMLDILDERDIELRKLKPAPYASELVNAIRGNEPQRLLDKLLVAALIEARSCERFSILKDGVEDDPQLAAFYEELFRTEADHHTLYTGLAREFFPHDEVKSRLQELADLEVEALKAGKGQIRLHSY